MRGKGGVFEGFKRGLGGVWEAAEKGLSGWLGVWVVV